MLHFKLLSPPVAANLFKIFLGFAFGNNMLYRIIYIPPIYYFSLLSYSSILSNTYLYLDNLQYHIFYHTLIFKDKYA